MEDFLHTDTYLQRLQVLVELKRFEDVLSLGEKTLQEEHGDGRVLHYMAMASFYLNRYDEALQMAEAAANMGALSVNLLYLMGEIFFAKKEYRKAQELAQLALEKDPEKASAFILLTKICLETGDLKKADEYVAQVLHLEPQNYFALNIKSLLLKTEGDEEGSRHYEELAMKENPNHTYGFQIRGAKAMMQGDWESAQDNYKEARRLNPQNEVAHKQLRKLSFARLELMKVFFALTLMGAFFFSIFKIFDTEMKEFLWLMFFSNIILGLRSFLPQFRRITREILRRNWVSTSRAYTILRIWRYIYVLLASILLGMIVYHSMVAFDYGLMFWESVAFFVLALLDLVFYGLANDKLENRGLLFSGIYVALLLFTTQTPDSLGWVAIRLSVGEILSIVFQVFALSNMVRKNEA